MSLFNALIVFISCFTLAYTQFLAEGSGDQNNDSISCVQAYNEVGFTMYLPRDSNNYDLNCQFSYGDAVQESDGRGEEVCTNLTTAIQMVYKQIDSGLVAYLLSATRDPDTKNVVVRYFVTYAHQPVKEELSKQAQKSKKTQKKNATQSRISNLRENQYICGNGTIVNGGTAAVILNNQEGLLNSTLQEYLPPSPYVDPTDLTYVIRDPTSQLIANVLDSESRDINQLIVTQNITLNPVVSLPIPDTIPQNDIIRIFYGLQALACLARNPTYSVYTTDLACSNGILESYSFIRGTSTIKIEYLVFDTSLPEPVAYTASDIAEDINNLGPQKSALALGRETLSITPNMDYRQPGNTGKTVNVLGLVFGLIFTVIFIAVIVIMCYMWGKYRDRHNILKSPSGGSNFLGSTGQQASALPMHLKQQNQARFGNTNNAFAHSNPHFAAMQTPSTGSNFGVHSRFGSSNNVLKNSWNLQNSGTAESGFNSRTNSSVHGSMQLQATMPQNVDSNQPNAANHWMDWANKVAGNQM